VKAILAGQGLDMKKISKENAEAVESSLLAKVEKKKREAEKLSKFTKKIDEFADKEKNY
jgi:hypothetical protein